MKNKIKRSLPLLLLIVVGLPLLAALGVSTRGVGPEVRPPLSEESVGPTASSSVADQTERGIGGGETTAFAGDDRERTTLGGKASRSYSIRLPSGREWQRVSLNRASTYGAYGSPYFDERLTSSARADDQVVVIVQANLRTEAMPLFPPETGYCADEQPIAYAGKQLVAKVRSALLGQLATTKSDASCGVLGPSSYGREHAAELSFCIDAGGEPSDSEVVRGSGEFYNTCPARSDLRNSDYLRIGISCTGQRWADTSGQTQCLMLLQDIVSSMQQQAT
jgi:hypothetical protein